MPAKPGGIRPGARSLPELAWALAMVPVHRSFQQRGWVGQIGGAEHGPVDSQKAGVKFGDAGGCDGGPTQLDEAMLGALDPLNMGVTLCLIRRRAAG
jgi:hypothetical protein